MNLIIVAVMNDIAINVQKLNFFFILKEADNSRLLLRDNKRFSFIKSILISNYNVIYI